MVNHPAYTNSRAIFIAEIEQFGGAERSVLALSRWLHQHGLDNHLVTYFDHCNIAKYATHPLDVVELKPAGGARSKIAALRQHFATYPDDAPRPLLNGYQPALHASLAGMRGFHHLMHDTAALFSDQQTRTLPNRLRIAISNRIAGIGLRSGGRTIVTSEFLRDECLRDFGVHANIVRMGGFVDPDTFRLRPVTDSAGNTSLRILSVCRIEENKRIDWILQSLADLQRRQPSLSSRVDWQLDLVGKGSLIPSLRTMADNLGIGQRIHFHGFVSDDDLAHIYAAAHFFLMPAVQGYGIPGIEALQRGIPILLHRESGVSDILQNTPWATVLCGNKEAMTAALSSAIEAVIAGTHHAFPLPTLPTEDQWAAEVAQLCNWT